MRETFLCQGRTIYTDDVSWLRSWIGEHPEWSRYRIARELCKFWNWQTSSGQLKDFAARSFLCKLMDRGLITLPPIRTEMKRQRGYATPTKTTPMTLLCVPIDAPLSELTPISLIIPDPGSDDEHRFHHYLVRYHYPGFHRTVGENLKYLVCDQQGRDLACVLFGAAAWKTKSRDLFIGWNDTARTRHLSWLTNNTRFLVLPWVRVPHLATHLLARILRRIRADWQAKYSHTVYLVETFVERDRFRGTCYKAANWKLSGHTTGRSRQDRYNTITVPVKDVYLYPLVPHFREILCHEDAL
jgi:hypothetical protein